MNLNELNPEQQRGVTTVEGPLLLLAGAGTGKTRVITYRIAYLISVGVAPGNILAVTFTNKAAREMKERVGLLLSEDAVVALTIGTFHSFCAQLLRRRIHHLGYTGNFSIMNDAYQMGLMRNVMTELGYIGDGRDPRLWLALISKAKCALLSPEDLREQDDTPRNRELAQVYDQYQRRMQLMNLVDFDDLLVLVVKLWQKCPEVLVEHQQKYRYLLIDEYQDTNSVQFQLMAMLAGENCNICVVGDDDQSIYGWRGADVGNILQFDSHFPNATVIRLEQNYRSTSTILNAANHVIANNSERHDKKLWSNKGEGEKILAVRCSDEVAEAKFVVDVLREKCMSHNQNYGKFAVLFRSNLQSRSLEHWLRQAKIPYSIVGSRSFYQRKEVLDIISLLQAVGNPKDDMSFLRIVNVPPRGVGNKSLERLRHWQRMTSLPLQQLVSNDDVLGELPAAAAANLRKLNDCLNKYRDEFTEPGDLAAKVQRLLEDSGYVDGLVRMYKPRSDALVRRENVYEFINEIAEFANRKGATASLREFLEAFALLDANDKEEQPNADGAVTLMTVHAGKGLEFPVVIIVGMERGLFPHSRAIEDHTEDEERRLFYVALTRAQEELVLTYAERRRVKGHVVRRRPSPFLDELPEDLVLFRTPEDALEPVTPEVASDFLAQMKAMFTTKP